MSEIVPSIGRIVHFELSDQDASEINRRRTNSRLIAERMNADPPAWPSGAQAHIGNEAKSGQMFPMLIVQVWGSTPTSCVNGQVFLDGNDVFWATSVSAGEGPHTFRWPTRN